jgi:hypothetical protein
MDRVPCVRQGAGKGLETIGAAQLGAPGEQEKVQTELAE